MKTEEFAAKTVDLAIEKGLTELNVTRDRVEVEVLSTGGLLSKAKVRITVKDSAGERAKDFLEKVLSLLGVSAFVDLTDSDEEALLNIVGSDVSPLFGRRGETIDALQYLASLIANADQEGYHRIVLDSDNYRQARQERLESIADSMAEKAIARGFRIKLDPMNPYERRVIHAKLQGNTEVTTHSEGEEPNRYLVITPVKSKSQSYDPTRNASMGSERKYSERPFQPSGRGGYGNRDNGFQKDRNGFQNRERRDGDKPPYANGDKPAFGNRNGDKPAYGNRNGDKPAYGNRNGDKPAYGNRGGYGNRDRSDRPALPPRAKSSSIGTIIKRPDPVVETPAESATEPKQDS